MKRILALLTINLFLLNGCMAWPGLTALLGLVGNDKGSEGLFFLPPGGGEGAGNASPDRETPPPTDLDPGNKDPIVLTRVEISSNGNAFPLGTHKDLQLTAIYSNNTNTEITDLVNWISDDDAIIEIDANQEDHPGRVIARSLGTTSIRSTFQGQEDEIELTVTNAALVRIEADPSNLSIIRGMTSEFHITGIFTDGTIEDLTDDSNTSYSFASNIASPNQPSISRMRGDAVGASSLTITHTAPNGTFQDTMNVTVNSPALVSIQVEPENPSRALGLTKQFTAIGTYENGETQDITEDVTWISQDPTKAIFYAHPIPKGEIQTLEEGTVPIQAGYGSILSDPVSLTILQKQLTSIAISPSSYSLAKGLHHNFTATGTFTDSTTEDITDEITWSSLNPSIATISNASPNRGRATALEIGSTSIQASYSTFSASATLNITSAILTSIAVVPNNAETVAGEFRQYSAIGTYSDASTQDLTTSVTWSVSPSSFASIANSIGNHGRLQGISAGAVTVTANHSSPNLTASVNGTILAADTTPPTIVSATSLSPTTVQVTFSEQVDSTQATNASNYRIARSTAVTGVCSNNTNFGSPQTGDFSIDSVTPSGGSGSIYVLHLSSSQSFGQNYTLIANKSGIADLAGNNLDCSNSASFEGQALLRVTSATCDSLNRIALTFSKPVLGGNVAGSAECNSIASCSQRYRLVDPGLGSITSAQIFDGTVCNGAPANNSRVCITHSLLQGGSNYNIIAANGIDGDGFNDASYGAIRDFTDSENLQSNPRDRAGFSGCGVAPNNFADGPISSDTFGDGTSFGYLTNYNSQIYVGPNAKGNSAARFNFDGTSPQNVGFTIERNTGHSNSATSRDGGIGVPPFVTMGHSGCTL
ncbi:MAG: Ig-like domain-containing protein, partial [Oceanicaulis sp.]|nr:Ig-like domain-containing protein [Oceanicaulis sp.]